MNPPRRLAAVGLCVPLLVAACAGRQSAAPETVWEPATAALYKARVGGAEGARPRRFRLLLFAELPDRLHGEVISPLGRTEMIADAGGGRISVLFVRDRVAFVGI